MLVMARGVYACVVLATAQAPAAPVAPVEPLAPAALGVEVTAPVAAPPSLPARPEPATALHAPERHLRLALAEATLGLIGGVFWYYRNISQNQYDVDYDWSTTTWKKKLVTFEALRFDDNPLETNVLYHPLVGTGWYLIFRGNRLSPIESFLLTVAYSTFWELMVEYREVLSINDLIATPMAGIAIGEPMVQTSAFLRTGTPSPAGRVFAALLNPLETVNRALEGAPSSGGETSDRYGIPLSYPHRLGLEAGVRNASFPGGEARTELVLQALAEVDMRPDLPSPGRDHRTVGPGALNRIGLETALDGEEMTEARIATKLSLFGGLWRTADGPDGTFVSSTRRFFCGLGTGFEYATRARPNQPEDLLGITKLVGSMLDWRFANERYRLHLAADAFYDFAAVSASAVGGYVTANGTVGLPSVLTLHGYYFAQGVSLSARAVLDVGRWELAASFTEDDFWWLHGRDRFPPDAPRPSAWDRRATVQGHLAVHPFSRSPFQLTIAGAHTIRDGSMGAIRSDTSESRLSTLLGLRF